MHWVTSAQITCTTILYQVKMWQYTSKELVPSSRQRQTERQRERQTDNQTEGRREAGKERERETHTQTHRDGKIETHTDTQRQKDNRQMNRHMEKKKGQWHKQIDNQKYLCETAPDLPSSLSSLSSPLLLSKGK